MSTHGHWSGNWEGYWHGPTENDPNALSGVATLSIQASGEISAASGDISGVASLSLSVTGTLSNGNPSAFGGVSFANTNPKLFKSTAKPGWLSGVASLEITASGRLTFTRAAIKARRYQVAELLELI